jgi:hypothetical protein
MNEVPQTIRELFRVHVPVDYRDTRSLETREKGIDIQLVLIYATKVLAVILLSVQEQCIHVRP